MSNPLKLAVQHNHFGVISRGNVESTQFQLEMVNRSCSFIFLTFMVAAKSKLANKVLTSNVKGIADDLKLKSDIEIHLFCSQYEYLKKFCLSQGN
jgi:hypothetical protein